MKNTIGYWLFTLLAVSSSAVVADAAGPHKTAANGASAWWSLQPLVQPRLPRLDGNDEHWVRTPIDRFILARLRANGLSPAAEADRRTLARRLYFDLVGMPPSPEDLAAFTADLRPDAYERLVDKLLASPQYGERWGRHWLDVVHYGDTHGYDKDKPRPNAWPYRDYVIRAFNADKPYARFVQEQIAGDVLFPQTVDGVEALGFIAAGPWDFIGHAEVPESKIDGKIARHLDRDDMITNTMMTFVSLTVQCAQCHNHKFDPITQEDYYSLQAVFAALDRADKKYYRDPQTAATAARLQTEIARLSRRQQELRTQVSKLAGPRLLEIERLIAAAQKVNAAPEKRPEYGYHSVIAATPEQIKWVQVDLGSVQAIDRVVLVGCHDEFNNIGAGFGFPVRYRVELSTDPEFTAPIVRVERTDKDNVNPGVAPQTIRIAGKSARYVRVTATKLALRANDYIFALAELQVYGRSGKNLALGASVTALDSIEAPPRWRKSNLCDGHYFDAAPAMPANVIEFEKQRRDLLDATVPGPLRQEADQVAAALAAAQAAVAKLPAPAAVYAGIVHHGSGAFLGTGAAGGTPRPIHLLARGDVKNPGSAVAPGALSALTALPSRFPLPPNHNEGERRAALACWLTAGANPLTWRSVVNRVWRFHFGRGLVETPNDFGRMGQTPSHPELLDWLAAEFRDRGQSIKQLHRLLVTSSTYRQSANAAAHDTALARDADNSLYWRMNRRRLEAEAVRDSVLVVSGKLDRRMAGPAFQDFVIEKPEHSPHYQYQLHDPDDPRSQRRSVYRFLVRSQQQPFMTTLDCADPSMQVDRRNETLSALQALALLNNNFMLTMARHFAERVEKSTRSTPNQVERAFHLAIGRTPTEPERSALTDYAKKHGLANLCRVLFNLNEFTFAD